MVVVLRSDSNNGTSSYLFYDCLDSGKSWADCRVIVQATYLTSRSEAEGNLEERWFLPTLLGILPVLGQCFGLAEKCYSINKPGCMSWLTKTAVSSLSTLGYAFAALIGP